MQWNLTPYGINQSVTSFYFPLGIQGIKKYSFTLRHLASKPFKSQRCVCVCVCVWLSHHSSLRLTTVLSEFLANPSKKVPLSNFWLLLSFHHLSSVTPCWTLYHGMGRVPGHYRLYLRGPERPWESAPTPELLFAWKRASSPCSSTSRESE